MSTFKPISDKPINNAGSVSQSNYPKVEASSETEFGTIDVNSYKQIQFNTDSANRSVRDRDNNTTNIRITLSERAVRLDKYNFAIGEFDRGFPDNDVYKFCNPELAIIFQNGGNQFTRKTQKDTGYPFQETVIKVIDSIKNNQYSKDFAGNASCACPNGTQPDPITGKCVISEKCMPEPSEPCPEPEFVNLKNTIHGYAYYVDRIKKVDIPNIGPRLVRCAGGHRCNRTHFRPQLKLSDNSVINASNNISMDNVLGRPEEYPSVPQINPIFDSSFMPGEVGDSFTFNVPDPTLLDNTGTVALECLSSTICHTSVTMIFLVGQRTDNDEYVLLFADCVAPGNINAQLLGSVPCNDDDQPVDCCYYGGLSDCSPTPPPINCSYLQKTAASITFTNIDIPLESMGSQDLVDDLEALIYNGPHIVQFTQVNQDGILSDPYLIGTISGVLQVFVFFNAVTDGLGNLTANATLNIINIASAYPYVYAVSFIETVLVSNLCDLSKADGRVSGGDGISGATYTGNGDEEVDIQFI
jgi:hypothetical protein